MRLFCLKKAEYFKSAVAYISVMIGPVLFLLFAFILSLLVAIIINVSVTLRHLKRLFKKIWSSLKNN
jgi:hypothetical protein